MIYIPINDDFEIECGWFKHIPFNCFFAQIIGYLLVRSWIKVEILTPRQMSKEYYRTEGDEKEKDKKKGLEILGMWDRETRRISLSTNNKSRLRYWLVYLHELAHTRKLSVVELLAGNSHGPDWATIYITIAAKSAGIFWFLGGGGMSATVPSTKNKKHK